MWTISWPGASTPFLSLLVEEAKQSWAVRPAGSYCPALLQCCYITLSFLPLLPPPLLFFNWKWFPAHASNVGDITAQFMSALKKQFTVSSVCQIYAPYAVFRPNETCKIWQAKCLRAVLQKSIGTDIHTDIMTLRSLMSKHSWTTME